MRIKRCLTCCSTYDPVAWCDLEPLGVQDIKGEGDERNMCLDWRKCTCGNACNVDLCDPSYNDFARVHAVISVMREQLRAISKMMAVLP